MTGRTPRPSCDGRNARRAPGAGPAPTHSTRIVLAIAAHPAPMTPRGTNWQVLGRCPCQYVFDCSNLGQFERWIGALLRVSRTLRYHGRVSHCGSTATPKRSVAALEDRGSAAGENRGPSGTQARPTQTGDLQPRDRCAERWFNDRTQFRRKSPAIFADEGELGIASGSRQRNANSRCDLWSQARPDFSGIPWHSSATFERGFAS